MARNRDNRKAAAFQARCAQQGQGDQAQNQVQLPDPAQAQGTDLPAQEQQRRCPRRHESTQTISRIHNNLAGGLLVLRKVGKPGTKVGTKELQAKEQSSAKADRVDKGKEPKPQVELEALILALSNS